MNLSAHLEVYCPSYFNRLYSEFCTKRARMKVTTTPSVSLSVVIPTLNEISALPANLTRLIKDQHVCQIIIVDGGSSDGTCEYVNAQTDQRIVLLDSAPGRGRQLNTGARYATGDWIIFHHADTLLPDHAGLKITSLEDSVHWGGYQHKFSHGNWKLNFVSMLHNWRCAITGVIYGDQSLFVRSKFFWEIGGFVEEELEDLEFSDRALLRQPSMLLSDKILTDSRKFRQLGEFRALAHVISILLRYERRRSIGNTTFFDPYR